MREKKCGIYQIRNLINGKMYVGQSIDLHTRKLMHFNDLCTNRHTNIHLQNAYNKYGKENFIFEIIVRCDNLDVDQLTECEQFYVNLYKDQNILYNIRKECVNSNKGVIASDKTRALMSRNNSGENNPNYGKIHPEKTKKLMSENHYDCSGKNGSMWGQDWKR